MAWQDIWNRGPMGKSVRNGGADPRKPGLLAALPTCPTSGAFCKLQRPFWYPLVKLGTPIFSKLKTTFRKSWFIAAKSKAAFPGGGKTNRNPIQGLSAWKTWLFPVCSATPARGSDASWMKGLWASAWESLTLLVLSPTGWEGFPATESANS